MKMKLCVVFDSMLRDVVSCQFVPDNERDNNMFLDSIDKKFKSKNDEYLGYSNSLKVYSIAILDSESMEIFPVDRECLLDGSLISDIVHPGEVGGLNG